MPSGLGSAATPEAALAPLPPAAAGPAVLVVVLFGLLLS